MLCHHQHQKGCAGICPTRIAGFFPHHLVRKHVKHLTSLNSWLLWFSESNSCRWSWSQDVGGALTDSDLQGPLFFQWSNGVKWAKKPYEITQNTCSIKIAVWPAKIAVSKRTLPAGYLNYCFCRFETWNVRRQACQKEPGKLFFHSSAVTSNWDLTMRLHIPTHSKGP